MFEENYLFHVPEQKRIKVILDSDVRNEVDDQFAIMHADVYKRQGIVGQGCGFFHDSFIDIRRDQPEIRIFFCFDYGIKLNTRHHA